MRKGSIKMKVNKVLFVLFFIGFTASCATTYDVKHDYDRQVNFSDLKTFDWMQTPERAGANSLIVQRVKNAVNAELKAKGLRMTSENPDLLIAEFHGKRDRVKVTDWGDGFDRGYRRGHWGTGGVSAYTYEEGSLILDFVDAKSKKLIWQGSAKARVDNVDSPEESEKLINAAVNDILKAYPPSMSK